VTGGTAIRDTPGRFDLSHIGHRAEGEVNRVKTVPVAALLCLPCGILHDEGVKVTVCGVSGGGFDADIRGHAAQNEVLDPLRRKKGLQPRPTEDARAGFVDDNLAGAWGEFLDDVGAWRPSDKNVGVRLTPSYPPDQLTIATAWQEREPRENDGHSGLSCSIHEPHTARNGGSEEGQLSAEPEIMLRSEESVLHVDDKQRGVLPRNRDRSVIRTIHPRFERVRYLVACHESSWSEWAAPDVNPHPALRPASVSMLALSGLLQKVGCAYERRFRMRISIDQLRERIVRTLTAHGVPAKEAVIGAEMCIDAELREHRSHGVRLIRNVLAEYAQGSARRSPLSIAAETPVSAQVDGGFHLSWYVHQRAVDLAIQKANESGIGLVSVRNAGVSGALGWLAERIAQQSLVGIVLTSTPVTVVAPGTAIPTLGTNPIAIGFPRANGMPLVLDMATSAIAFNQIRRLRELGQPLPAGVANGPDATPTTDADAAIDPVSGRGRILPFGGHRGYGLALMLELLVSAGVTGRAGSTKRGPVVLEPSDFAAIYLAYQPTLLGSVDSMDIAATELIAELESLGARIPGENSAHLRAHARADGFVEVDDTALALLDN
jgi:L-2-hydroxycarboxylate dehydrogenase (NAD+)